MTEVSYHESWATDNIMYLTLFSVLETPIFLVEVVVYQETKLIGDRDWDMKNNPVGYFSLRVY